LQPVAAVAVALLQIVPQGSRGNGPVRACMKVADD
jgi:hypothetical protein